MKVPGCGVPLVVSKTFSALLGNPSQDGVWVSGSISTQWMNSSRLEQNKITGKFYFEEIGKSLFHYSETLDLIW